MAVVVEADDDSDEKGSEPCSGYLRAGRVPANDCASADRLRAEYWRHSERGDDDGHAGRLGRPPVRPAERRRVLQRLQWIYDCLVPRGRGRRKLRGRIRRRNERIDRRRGLPERSAGWERSERCSARWAARRDAGGADAGTRFGRWRDGRRTGGRVRIHAWIRG